jgi:RHS repeat-associated protein
VTSGYEHIAAINSYTYSGYRYDSEIGMYYLNSRYYNPEIGRFINSDGLIDLGYMLSNNVFIYCSNNPILFIDPLGFMWVYNNFFELKSFNEIHIAVQIYLAGRHGLVKEHERSDLYRSSTGEVWEVKPISYSYNLAKRALAYAQLHRYIRSIRGAKIGSNLGNGVFNHYSKNGHTYEVSWYSDSFDGLIFYEFKRRVKGLQLSPETVTFISYAIVIGLVIGMRGSGIGRKYLDHAY